MRAEFLSYLRCPVCGEVLAAADQSVRCPAGHTFDTARQGYLNLMAGPAPTDGDTTEMVAARAELLAAGHFDFLTDALTREADELLPPYSPGLVLDVGAGTGHHLAAVLDRHPEARGLALDVAKPAARRAARAHPRAAAVVCDVWRRLPIADGCADLVLDVFAPRNGAEFARVLRPGGALVVVTRWRWTPTRSAACRSPSSPGCGRFKTGSTPCGSHCRMRTSPGWWRWARAPGTSPRPSCPAAWQPCPSRWT
jgi:23S rRNA (guanine745-N1)-methyltransferase